MTTTPTTKKPAKMTRTGKIRTGFEVQGVRYGADEWKKARAPSKRTGCRVIRFSRTWSEADARLWNENQCYARQLTEIRRVLDEVNNLVVVFEEERVLVRHGVAYALNQGGFKNVQNIMSVIETGDSRINQARRRILGEEIARNANFAQGVVPRG